MSVLPGGGDAADLVEPVRHQGQVVESSFRISRRLDHGEALPVGMEGEIPGDTSVCQLPLRPQPGPSGPQGVSLDRIADHHDSVVAHPVKQFFSVRGPDRKPTPAGGNLPLPARAGRTLHTFPIRWSCRQSSAHHVHRTHRDSTKCGMTWKDLHPAENNLSGFIQALVLLVKPTHPTTFFLIHRHSLPYQVFRRVYPV